ncbi:hypothetical protein [Chromobacterium vaccinii]|uniref:hypothetical protein n=1 Tax=Chromobacterium vaccinii TaxID=1108595 RepID=UPI001319C96C|nr:hypothetical protein [Chromobacterium vaccinii]
MIESRLSLCVESRLREILATLMVIVSFSCMAAEVTDEMHTLHDIQSAISNHNEQVKKIVSIRKSDDWILTYINLEMLTVEGVYEAFLNMKKTSSVLPESYKNNAINAQSALEGVCANQMVIISNQINAIKDAKVLSIAKKDYDAVSITCKAIH